MVFATSSIEIVTIEIVTEYSEETHILSPVLQGLKY